MVQEGMAAVRLCFFLTLGFNLRPFTCSRLTATAQSVQQIHAVNHPHAVHLHRNPAPPHLRCPQAEADLPQLINHAYSLI